MHDSLSLCTSYTIPMENSPILYIYRERDLARDVINSCKWVLPTDSGTEMKGFFSVWCLIALKSY